MNSAHLHLLVNHIPVLGMIFALLLLAIALWRRSDELLRLVLGAFVLLGVASVVVYLTGEPAEHAVRRLPDVSRGLIEEHEEAALAATIGVVALGVLSLAGLIVYRTRQLPRWLATAALVAALVPTGLMAWTANLGGQVRHSEIRGGASPVAAGAVAPASADRDGDH